MMSDIKIFPIFNQAAPGVWDDMMRVRVAAMEHNYNHKMSADEIAEAMANYQEKWNTYRKHFAFGAYDNDKLVGSIQGDCEDGVISMRQLYVLPDYQKIGIGRKLMSAMEDACAFDADIIELVALYSATPFYKSIGYTSPTHDNYLINDKISQVKGPHKITPMFWTNAASTRRCSALSKKSGQKFAPTGVDTHHSPVFIYRDLNGCVQGVAGPDKDAVFAESSYIARNLKRTLDTFLSHQAKIQKR